MKKLTPLFALISLFTLVYLSSASTNSFVTFVGGDVFDSLRATTVLDDGSVIVVGRSHSPNYPTTAGAFDTVCGVDLACGGEFILADVVVTKFAPDGSLVFSTFVGGDEDDGAHDVAVAADGSIVVVGFTKSNNFPTTAGAFDTSYNEPNKSAFGDGFIFKLSSDGSQLLYSSYIGGSQQDELFDVVVQNNDIYFSGFTKSGNFPTTAGVFDSSPSGEHDAFVGKLSADGSQLSYSTLIGGSKFDAASGLAVNSAGEATVVGMTRSSDFPVTAGVVDAIMAGSSEGFVARLNSSGSALRYSTFIGGNGSDSVDDVVLDAAGKVHLIGTTSSTDFTATLGAFDTKKSNQDDGYFAILNPTGTTFEYMSFTNPVSSGRYSGVAIDLLDDGSVFLGLSATETGGFSDRVPAFMWVNPAGNGEKDLLLDCTLCYRFDKGEITDLKATASGVVMTGETKDDKFSVTAGAFDTTFNGSHDGFLISHATPKTNDVDATINLPDTAFGAPNGTVSVPVSYSNLGATVAKNVQITATLAADLTYVSDSSGVVPQQNGNQLVWTVSDVKFNSVEAFDLVVQLPDAPLGNTFKIEIEISSDGPEAVASNNRDQMDVMVSTQIFLPLITR